MFEREPFSPLGYSCPEVGRDTLESMVLARLDSGVAEDIANGDTGDMGASPTEAVSKEGSLGRELWLGFFFVGVTQSGE